MRIWKEGVSDTFSQRFVRPLAGAMGFIILIIALFYPQLAEML